MASIHDPLRFGAEEADLEEEVPLQDEPLPSQAPEPEPAAALPPAPTPTVQPVVPSSSGFLDPLSSPATASLAAAPAASALAATARAAAASPAASEIAADAALLRGAAAAGNAAPEAAGARWLEITVTDPVKRISDGIIPGLTSTHTEYLVSSVPADQPRRRIDVRRRFSDFVAVDDLLSQSLRGCVLPPRPDKAPLGAAAARGDAFVESRRADLEKYLRRLAAHPAAGTSEELGVFLEADGSLAHSVRWAGLQPARGGLLEGVARLPRQLMGGEGSVPTAAEAATSARHTTDLLRRFRELGERVKQDYRSPPGGEGDEAMLRERRAELEEHQASLAVASAKAEALVKEFEHTGAVMGDLGLALMKLAKFQEDSAAGIGQYTDVGASVRQAAGNNRKVGMTAVRQSRMSRVATSQMMEALGPLHDELALSPAAVSALREREAALTTVGLMEEDLERKKRALAALEAAGARTLGGDPSTSRKLGAARDDLAALDAALAAARAEYARVLSRNKEELARRASERAADFQRLARGLAQTAALYEERSAQIWKAIAEEFGGRVELDRSRRQPH